MDSYGFYRLYIVSDRLLEESLLRVYLLQLIPASVDVKTIVATA